VDNYTYKGAISPQNSSKTVGKSQQRCEFVFWSVAASKKFFCSLSPIAFESDFAMNIPNIKVGRLT
jgi:hypothetical protein